MNAVIVSSLTVMVTAMVTKTEIVSSSTVMMLATMVNTVVKSDSKMMITDAGSFLGASESQEE